MIHVCFCFHDKTGHYSKFTGTTILSIFENTNSEVTVHILHDNTLTPENRDKFIYLAGRYGQLVKFYNVEELCPDKISEIIELAPDAKNSRVTVGAFYRLLTPVIIPTELDRIIYLDSDLIVNLDIKELWQIELGDKILAAVPEISHYKTNDYMKHAFKLCDDGIVKCEDYFNSGVLVMNLKLLRAEEIIMDGLRFCTQNPRYQGYPDQDILNYCFSTATLKLPNKFNRHLQYVRLEKESLTKKIYHYSGGSFNVGLGLDMNDSLNKLWFDYFLKSPWFDTDSIGRLYDSFRKSHIQQKESMVNLSATISGKTRAFIILESNLNEVVKSFSVKNDEEIIIADTGSPLQKIIDVINDSRKEKVFFLMLPQFPFNVLIEAGLVYNKDFFNAYDFLPEENNLLQKSYPFVKAM